MFIDNIANGRLLQFLDSFFRYFQYICPSFRHESHRSPCIIVSHTGFLSIRTLYLHIIFDTLQTQIIFIVLLACLALRSCTFLILFTLNLHILRRVASAICLNFSGFYVVSWLLFWGFSRNLKTIVFFKFWVTCSSCNWRCIFAFFEIPLFMQVSYPLCMQVS